LIINETSLCLLPGAQNIYFNAIILEEIFFIEDLDELFDGLDLIYSDLSSSFADAKYFEGRLDYRKIFQGDRCSPYYSYVNLPAIMNTRYHGGGEIIKDFFNAYHDLGPDIEKLLLTLNISLPSTLFLQIQANLASHISENMCDIMHNPHECTEEVIKTRKGEAIIRLTPERAKGKDILAIRNKIKEQTVNFLSTYFEGFFLKKAKKHISYVPCIDVYSLTYPEDPNDVKEWLLNNMPLFRYFNIRSYHSGFLYKEYLILENNFSDEPFTNFSLLVNR
jgi:hypothetical protein